MALVVAIGLAIYAFKVFRDLEWPLFVAVPLSLAIIALRFLPGGGSLVGISLFCGAALLLGMLQKSMCD